jgi:6-phosphogluconolactonase
MKTIMFCRVSLSVLAISLSLLLPGSKAVAQEDQQGEHGDVGSGRVYVLTNAAAANTVVIFDRAADGALQRMQEVPTGGLGSGPAPIPPPFPPGPGPNPLDSQDGLKMSDDGRFLLAVNAGSDDLSVLAVTQKGLRVVDKVPSGGAYPVSIAIHRAVVYVLNFGGRPTLQGVAGTPTMRGFRLNSAGKLHEIPDSTRVTGDFGSGPSQIVFDPDGDILAITEMFTNRIDVFRVTEDGRTGERTSIPSNTVTPLAIEFGRHHVMTVTEGNDISPRVAVLNGSSVSSYRLTDEDTLEPVSRSVSTTQTGACWIRITPNGRYAYTGNTGSGSVSSYTVSRNGVVTLLAARAGDTGGLGSVPIDISITPDGRFLYVLASLSGAVRGFSIAEDGSLTPVASAPGLPMTIQGIVAR